MENQHRKITGYRELSQAEIDLMNTIKEHGKLLYRLVNNLEAMQGAEAHHLDVQHMSMSDDKLIPAHLAAVVSCAEAKRWTAIGKTALQQGLMALTRAVARPDSF